MAGEAAWEFIMKCLIVWLTMTVGALRYVTVLVLVAGDAGYRLVLTGTLRQFVEYFVMTGAASARRHITTENDLLWLVNRMALEAG